MLDIGSLIAGKYRVLHEIGKGGMSTVYLVLNEKANKQWALKEVRKTEKNNEKIVTESLITELNILKKLSHPHLPTIVDVIEDGDRLLILMDYIEGVTLARTLKDEGPQKEEDVIKWMKQLCGVLEYLHSQDPPIIYRDLKPSNIMLKPDGDVVLIDFGTAKEVVETHNNEETTSLGTRGYAAPEQLGGMGRTDGRTDIYSLGATAYHLLTGHSPAAYPYEIYPIRHWNENLSGGLEEIILRCTESDPDKRYQTCEALLYDLDHYYEFDENYKKDQNRKIHRTIAMGILSVFLLLAGGGALLASHLVAKNNYDTYMRKAASAMNPAEKEKSYKDAIRLVPSRNEAYDGLISDVYLEDGTFTKKEAEDLLTLLGTDTGDGLIEDKLAASPAYGEVSYRVGMAYFYYYNEDGGITMSKSWLDSAAADESLPESVVTRSRILSGIASYYKSLNEKDKAGDTAGDYRAYYDDLSDLMDLDIEAADNQRTALVTYRETSYQILNGVTQFYDAGMTLEDMLSLTGRIRKNLESLDKSSFDETDQTIYDEAMGNLDSAAFEIENLYGGNK